MIGKSEAYRAYRAKERLKDEKRSREHSINLETNAAIVYWFCIVGSIFFILLNFLPIYEGVDYIRPILVFVGILFALIAGAKWLIDTIANV